MKQVNPNKYTKKYFTKDCGGHFEWQQSQGRQLPHRLGVVFNLSNIKKGMNIVDFGCGRGELSYQAALKGANVLGLDYSKEAIKLAKSLPKTKQGSLGFKSNKKLKIPIKNNSIDMIFFVDVLEHLYPKQLKILLKEFYRVLKPGGKIIIHTAPNRLYYDFGYPYYTRWISMLVNPFWKIIFKETLITGKILRTDYEREMHVNECTLGEVKQFFSDAKFQINAWLSSECQIFRKRDYIRYMLLQPEFGPLKNFFSYDILGIAIKPQK